MQKQLLENIIRKFLFENDGRLSIDLGKVTTRDRELFEKQITPMLKTTAVYDAKDAGLVRIDIIRIGGRTKVGDNKISSYDEKLVTTDAIDYLNRFRSGLVSDHTTSDFVWFLIVDPYSKSSNKQEKIRAKYSVLAIYVRTSLLYKTPPSVTGTGWLDKLNRGSNVYDFNRIKMTEWKVANKASADVPIQGGDVLETIDDLPLANLKYGDKFTSNTKAMNMLYAYFELNFVTLNFLNIRDFKTKLGFGCELKSIIEQFQEEQNIPVTGEWDTKTRQAAVSLGKLEYSITNKDALKSKYEKCALENLDLQNIKYPAGGSFTPDNTKQRNIEFVKVQTLMLNYVIKKSQRGKLPENKEWYKQLQSKSGIYSAELVDGVRLVRKLAEMDPNDISITSELIEKIR